MKFCLWSLLAYTGIILLVMLDQQALRMPRAAMSILLANIAPLLVLVLIAAVSTQSTNRRRCARLALILAIMGSGIILNTFMINSDAQSPLIWLFLPFWMGLVLVVLGVADVLIGRIRGRMIRPPEESE